MNTAGVRLINDDCEHFFQTKTTNNTGLFLPSFRSQHPHLHSLLLSPHIYPVQHPRPTDLYNSGFRIIYSVGSYWDSFFSTSTGLGKGTGLLPLTTTVVTPRPPPSPHRMRPLGQLPPPIQSCTTSSTFPQTFFKRIFVAFPCSFYLSCSFYHFIRIVLCKKLLAELISK